MAGERRRLVGELTAHRQAAGLSQTQVAARMGTSQSAVARIEAGEGDMRASTLERYAAAVGSQISWRLLDSPPAGQVPPSGPASGSGGAPGSAPLRRRARGAFPARAFQVAHPVACGRAARARRALSVLRTATGGPP